MLNFLRRKPDLKSTAANLTQYGVSATERDRFVAYLESAPDRDLFHFNPRYLAERMQLNERAALRLLLAAVHDGVVKLHWDVVCPTCGAEGHLIETMSQLHHRMTCPACHTESVMQLDGPVHVTFSLHPRLRELPPSADDIKYRSGIDARLRPFTGQSLLLLPDFQQLFPRERLLPDESLEVSRIAIVFTDLAGSTALYAARGDPRAYHLVRLHFDVLFETANVHQGTVVKNIGDAVMAAFQTPAEALQAALAMQTGIMALNARENLSRDEALILKIGLHSGPCLNVTLNDRPDYFGTTVNVAARVQNFSRGQDVVLTEVIRTDADARPILEAHKLETMRQGFKGLDEEVLVHRLVV